MNNNCHIIQIICYVTDIDQKTKIRTQGNGIKFYYKNVRLHLDPYSRTYDNFSMHITNFRKK